MNVQAKRFMNMISKKSRDLPAHAHTAQRDKCQEQQRSNGYTKANKDLNPQTN